MKKNILDCNQYHCVGIQGINHNNRNKIIKVLLFIPVFISFVKKKDINKLKRNSD